MRRDRVNVDMHRAVNHDKNSLYTKYIYNRNIYTIYINCNVKCNQAIGGKNEQLAVTGGDRVTARHQPCYGGHPGKRGSEDSRRILAYYADATGTLTGRDARTSISGDPNRVPEVGDSDPHIIVVIRKGVDARLPPLYRVHLASGLAGGKEAILVPSRHPHYCLLRRRRQLDRSALLIFLRHRADHHEVVGRRGVAILVPFVREDQAEIALRDRRPITRLIHDDPLALDNIVYMLEGMAVVGRVAAGSDGEDTDGKDR